MTEDTGFNNPGEDGRTGLFARLLLVLRLLVRLIGYGFIFGVVAFAAGFIVFYQFVASMNVPKNPRADAIVVLTGGYQRIDQAVQLLSEGAGRRLLISGVNPTTTGNQIRLLTRSSTSLFDCCVDIGHEAMDTTGNALETTRWIKERDYRSVILVTNNYHMPRSLAELRRVDRETEFIPYPVLTGVGPGDIIQNPLVLRTLASEYVKFLLVKIREWLDLSP